MQGVGLRYAIILPEKWIATGLLFVFSAGNLLVNWKG